MKENHIVCYSELNSEKESLNTLKHVINRIIKRILLSKLKVISHEKIERPNSFLTGLDLPVEYYEEKSDADIIELIEKAKYGITSQYKDKPTFIDYFWRCQTPLYSCGGTFNGTIVDKINGIIYSESLYDIEEDKNLYESIQKNGLESLAGKEYQYDRVEKYASKETLIQWSNFSPQYIIARWGKTLQRTMIDETIESMGDCILDLGCGGGGKVPFMLQKDIRVVGIDINPNAEGYFNRIRDSLPDEKKRMEFYHAPCWQLPHIDNFFTGIYTFDVLEHIFAEDLLDSLKEVYRVLKPGGKFIVCCPNSGGHDRYGGWIVDREIHVSFLTLDSLKSKLEEAGFIMEQEKVDERQDSSRTQHDYLYFCCTKR